MDIVKEKSYTFEVSIIWTQVTHGNNKKEAIERLKDTFEEEYNFRPENNEIKEIK